MLTENSAVLKEWATVIEALHTQRQIILFRKGGIIEKNHQFEVESPEFFLFPTYLHQTAEQLQPAFADWIPQTEARKPAHNKVALTHYATVEKVLEAKGIERLRELTDAYIWTPEYVEKTWSWAPEKPAYVLFLRVYALKTPHIITELPEYGGCISWIKLKEALPVGELTPVMDDVTFTRRCREIENQLAQTVVAVS